jgi:hypothetical protein
MGSLYVVFDDRKGAILSGVEQATLFKRPCHNGQQLLLGDMQAKRRPERSGRGTKT